MRSYGPLYCARSLSPSALVYTRRTTRSKPRFNLINLVGIIGGAPQVGAITAAKMAAYSPQPTRTQPGSRGASTSGVGAPAAPPPDVRSRVSRGASSDPLHARGVFPLTLRCLPSRCACRIGYASCTGDVQSIRGASSGPLHARGVFPLTLVYHQDAHAASDMRAAPVMRSQSEGQKLWSASRAMSLFPLIHSLPSGCASRTKDEQSIDFHHPGCVRRIGAHRICELHTECVFDTCPQTGMCTPHRRCKLHTGRVYALHA